jgi:hypothetical protein
MAEREYADDGTPLTEVGADDAPFVYANVVNMNIGPFDVTMDFGYQAPEARHKADVEGGAPPEFKRVVRVAMSHGHAKSMIPIIAGLVANLESNVGTIPTPGFEEKSKE